MGIKGLMRLINDRAPGAVKEMKMAALFGRVVAIDASMSIYQTILGLAAGGDTSFLTNEAGEVTSHLQGLFYRTIRLMEAGIKPIYVFDGKPPELKKGELDKRRDIKEKAEKQMAEAKASDASAAEVARFEKRTVRVTKEQNEEVKTLLRLMGVPVVEAPCEAEASCAELCKAGKAYATGTEDMDALTFGTTRLCRNMSFSAARKLPVVEIDLAKVLEGLEFTMDQFIDLCVLMGCDYTGTIRGIGPVKAYKLIKEHGCTAEAVKHIDRSKHAGIDAFMHAEAAALFKAPEVIDASTVKPEWKSPDEEGLVKYLCDEKGFSEERIRSSVKRLVKAKGKSSQRRLDSFFGAPKGKPKPAPKRKGAASKKTPPSKKRK